MEYSLAFAKQLIEAAAMLKGPDLVFEERKRAVLYLSLLSIEITLKYLLEKAGVPVKEIRSRSHNIEDLLNDLDGCEFLSTTSGEDQFVPAKRIRARVVNPMYDGATIGNLLMGESKGASCYPNQIRYGPTPEHYPAKLMLETAKTLIEWSEQEGQTIRLANPPYVS